MTNTLDDTPDKLSCGIVVIRRANTGYMVLMLRAYRNWDFPKGIREDGEEPLEAAVREVGEETSIKSLEFEWGERCKDSGPYNRGKVARYYLACTEQEEVEMGIAPELGTPEHHEWRWVSFDEAYDLASPRVRLIVQWARQVVGV